MRLCCRTLCRLLTHRLGVESGPRRITWHLYDRERVPFTGADHGRVDVNIRTGLERVSPIKQNARTTRKQTRVHMGLSRHDMLQRSAKFFWHLSRYV